MAALRITVLLCAICTTGQAEQQRDTIVLRGHTQSVLLYGPASGRPVIVSSGDGGWIHLGPHVAEFLASRGFSVVGFDVRTYLESFTTHAGTLQPADVQADYKALAAFAARTTHAKPILIGVSEGAGLSVLAAADAQATAAFGGVIALGLPDETELGWRWTDAVTYLTHATPKEPTFSTAAVIANVAPLPLAAIHSLHDEYVPLAEAQTVLDKAREPKKLWLIDAANHRFSDKLDEFDARLIEAVEWVNAKAPG